VSLHQRELLLDALIVVAGMTEGAALEARVFATIFCQDLRQRYQ